MARTVADQIKDLENTRAAKVSRMDEVARKSIDEGRSMDEEETQEFDDLESEVKSLDQDLVRLQRLAKLQAAAKPVEPAPRGVDPAKHASATRDPAGPTVITRKDQDEKFKGQNFTRMVIAKTLAQQDGVSPVAIAQKRWGKTNPTVVECIKAAVEGGSSSGDTWGDELVHIDRWTGDFIEFLDSRTVFSQLPLREVPANINIAGQDGTGTGYWVGQSRAIPVSAQDFLDVNLTPLKAAALAVISNELMRDSSPAAEILVRDGLVNASRQRIDTTFLSNLAAVAGVSPAGLLFGLTGISASGNDGDAVRADIKALYNIFIAAKNATGLQFVMNPSLAKSLQLMTNALGQKEFPDIRQDGGTLEGDPVVTGENVGTDDLILLKPSDIYKIGDGGIQVSMSRDATIEMDNVPAGNSATPVESSENLVSMFQTESTAIKVVRSINFAKRRSHAVQYVEGAHYGSAST